MTVGSTAPRLRGRSTEARVPRSASAPRQPVQAKARDFGVLLRSDKELPDLSRRKRAHFLPLRLRKFNAFARILDQQIVYCRFAQCFANQRECNSQSFVATMDVWVRGSAVQRSNLKNPPLATAGEASHRGDNPWRREFPTARDNRATFAAGFLQRLHGASATRIQMRPKSGFLGCDRNASADKSGHSPRPKRGLRRASYRTQCVKGRCASPSVSTQWGRTSECDSGLLQARQLLRRLSRGSNDLTATKATGGLAVVIRIASVASQITAARPPVDRLSSRETLFPEEVCRVFGECLCCCGARSDRGYPFEKLRLAHDE